jgi:hypothetical protein
VTQDIVSSNGFGFQLNAISGQNSYPQVQQYVLSIWPNSNVIGADIQNWHNFWLKTADAAVVLHHAQVGTTPQPMVLPAGYILEFELMTDSASNVVAVRYLVVDTVGNVSCNKVFNFSDYAEKGIANYAAPVCAFELNLVGATGGEATTLTSGNGVITYTSPVPMMVGPWPPSGLPLSQHFPRGITGEQANSTYHPAAVRAGRHVHAAVRVQLIGARPSSPTESRGATKRSPMSSVARRSDGPRG